MKINNKKVGKEYIIHVQCSKREPQPFHTQELSVVIDVVCHAKYDLCFCT